MSKVAPFFGTRCIWKYVMYVYVIIIIIIIIIMYACNNFAALRRAIRAVQALLL